MLHGRNATRQHTLAPLNPNLAKTGTSDGRNQQCCNMSTESKQLTFSATHNTLTQAWDNKQLLRVTTGFTFAYEIVSIYYGKQSLVQIL
jgi:hypothetical protein